MAQLQHSGSSQATVRTLVQSRLPSQRLCTTVIDTLKLEILRRSPPCTEGLLNYFPAAAGAAPRKSPRPDRPAYKTEKAFQASQLVHKCIR